MAAILFGLKPTAVIALTATSTKTLLQLVAPSNHRVLIHGVEISCNGVTAADPPLLLELLVQSTAGTMTALTPLKWNPNDDETIQSTAQHTATAEPTAGNIMWFQYIHMQATGAGGLYIPLVRPLPVTGGTRMGLRYTSGAITAASNIAPILHCEE